MRDRRSFLASTSGSLAGLMFCGCGLLHARQAAAQTTAPPKPAAPAVRRSRVKTIDTHTHCYFQEALDLLGPEGAKAALPPVKGQAEHFDSIDKRLASMDAQGVDMQVLSINPFWYGRDPDLARAITKVNNEKLAELCARKKDRFAAFASLPLQNTELSVQMLEEAVKKQGLVGAAIGGSLQGEDFSAARFHPIWAKAQELGAVLFIHPQSTPELGKRFKGNGWLSNVIGNPLDTTIALNKLIFEGTLDKFPGLKVLAAHGGGYFGSYAPRSDHSCFVAPANCDPSIVLKKKPTEYLSQLWFDSLVFTDEGIRHLVAEVGADRVVIGSDSPIPWNEQPVKLIRDAKTLTPQQKDAILGHNAARLFGFHA
ncbi:MULTISPECIES: amidohydrolase family protein [Ramlibacter]|uniref:Amidohydrolase family protein n=1 Tax=Ramlibacter pinisoli TaxID=2682844 RepID=A0A6N8IVQ2_9BURK|nr:MULTISPECIES: amidohydrolase family protein [Ramlibacter]MBA2961090.1 amidohydrolase [Ramlibacter sp. CGMCC 1.13660]MVQ31034.1 amidohydrolase family protein [Ramlibacter pinisoli]